MFCFYYFLHCFLPIILKSTSYQFRINCHFIDYSVVANAPKHLSFNLLCCVISLHWFLCIVLLLSFLPSLPFLLRSLALFYALFFSCSLSCPSFTSLVPHITYIPFSFFLYISSFHSFLLTFFSSFLLFLHFPLFLFSFSSPSYIYISELNLADFITSPICECLLAPFQSCYSEAKCLFLV